jgi:hypothetical protein
MPGGVAPPNGGAVSDTSPAMPGGVAPPNGGAVSVTSPAMPGGVAPPNGGAVSIGGGSFLVYDDPHPLENTGHEYLGFNNWETDTWFDNLVVTPL